MTDEVAAITQEQRNGAKPDVTEPYTQQVISELRQLIDDADKAAQSDVQVRRRISFLCVGLDFTNIQAKIYRFLRRDTEKRLSADELAQARHLLDEKWLMMHRIFQDEHFAVNVSTMCWGEWGRFRRLGWEGPSQETIKTAGLAK